MWRPWLRISKADRDAMRSAAHAAIWVFVSLFVTTLLGWFGDLVDWLTEESVEFPSPSVLVNAAASAIIAMFAWIGSTIVGIANQHLQGND